MKRNIITLIIVVFAMMQTTAQTYDNLWKQADIIAQKDQPKSEIGVMQKIISKASAAKDYGQDPCRTRRTSWHRTFRRTAWW